MSARHIRAARRKHGRNALNPALPVNVAFESLRGFLRDARPDAKAFATRTQLEAPALPRASGVQTKGK